MNKHNLPRIILGLLFIVGVIYQIYGVINSCDGKYIYPLDDTYIHLSMAKNLSSDGIWGVTAHEFSSSSSSLLYTLILSVTMLIFGNNEYLPLLINLIAAYFLIIVIFNNIFRNLDSYKSSSNLNSAFSKASILTFISTFLIILFAPMLILTLSGMEHTLQILINLIFLIKFVEYFADTKSTQLTKLVLLAPLVTAIRFEGIFIIFLIIGLLAYQKRWRALLLIALSAASPIVIFGIISMMNGWMFLPNSILLKSAKPSDFSLINILLYPFSWIGKLLSEPHLFAIFVSSGSLLYVRYKQGKSLLEKLNLWLFLTILLTIIHLTFAKTGWVYRYEAYIVVIGLFGLAINILNHLLYGDYKLKKALYAVSIVLVIACGIRSYTSIIEFNTMSVNIYEQQYQMSRFLNTYYNDKSIVLGDIGATTYFTNIRLLDLVALGTIESLQLKIDKKFDSEAISELANKKNCQIAIIYKEAFKDYIPENWIEVGSWKINNNIGCYMDKVTFFATSGDNMLSLTENLIKFKNEMPTDIMVDIPLEKIIKDGSLY